MFGGKKNSIAAHNGVLSDWTHDSGLSLCRFCHAGATPMVRLVVWEARVEATARYESRTYDTSAGATNFLD